MITATESNMLERCMKTGLHIILQDEYISYEHALKQTNMKTLQSRRMILITKFGKKALKNNRFKDWFVEEIPQDEVVTRNKKPMKLYKEVKCRTSRYERSSLPFMTKLLSWHPPMPPPYLDLR